MTSSYLPLWNGRYEHRGSGSWYHSVIQLISITLLLVLVLQPFNHCIHHGSGALSSPSSTCSNSGVLLAYAADAKAAPSVPTKGSVRIALIDMGKYHPNTGTQKGRDKNLRPLSSVGETRDSMSLSLLLRCTNECRDSNTLLPFLTRQAPFTAAYFANLQAAGLPSSIANALDVKLLVNGSTTTQIKVDKLDNNNYLVSASTYQGTAPLLRITNGQPSNYSLNPLLVSAPTTRPDGTPDSKTQPNDPDGVARTYQCMGWQSDSYWTEQTEGGTSVLYSGILKVSRSTDEACFHPYYADFTPSAPPTPTPPAAAPTPTPPTSTPTNNGNSGSAGTTNTVTGSDFVATGGTNTNNDTTNNTPSTTTPTTTPPTEATPPTTTTTRSGGSGIETVIPSHRVNERLDSSISVLATIQPNTGVETLNVDWATSSYPPPQPGNERIIGARVSLDHVSQVSTVVGAQPKPFIVRCYGGTGGVTLTAITQEFVQPPIITAVGAATPSQQAFQIQLAAPTQTGTSLITLRCADAGSPQSTVVPQPRHIHRHDHYALPHDDHHLHHRHTDWSYPHHWERHEEYGRPGEYREHLEYERRAADYTTEDPYIYRPDVAEQSFQYNVAPAVTITNPLPDITTVQGRPPPLLQITCGGGYSPYTLTGTAVRVGRQPSAFLPGLFQPVTNGAASGPLFTITLPAPSPGSTKITLTCTDAQGFSKDSNAFIYTITSPVVISQPASITTVRGSVPTPFPVYCDGGRGDYTLSGYAVSRDSSRGPVTTEAVTSSIKPLVGKPNGFMIALPAAPYKGHAEITLTCTDSGGASNSAKFDYTVHDWVSIQPIANLYAVVGTEPESFPVICDGGFIPYTLQANSTPPGAISSADIHRQGAHFSVSMPRPTTTTPTVVTMTCMDSLGNMAATNFNYIVADRVVIHFPTNLNMLAEAVVGFAPAAFEIACSGGFPPYRLTAHSASDRPISGTEVERSLRRLTTSPTADPAKWLLSLPRPMVSGTTSISMRCRDESGHTDSKSFTYSVAGAISLTLSVESPLTAVVGSAPKPFTAECKGGYWPYRLTASSSEDPYPVSTAQLDKAISGQGPSFTVQLPIPHQRGQTELSFTCVDSAGYTVRTQLRYHVYEAVSISPIPMQRAVVHHLFPPFQVTCSGGIGPYQLVKQYADGGPSLGLKITGNSPTFLVHLEHGTQPDAAQFALQCLDSHKNSASEQFSFTVAAALTMDPVEPIHTIVNAAPRTFKVRCHGGFLPYSLTWNDQLSPRSTQLPRITIPPHSEGPDFTVTIASATSVVHSNVQLICTEATGSQTIRNLVYVSHVGVSVEADDVIQAVVGTRPRELKITCVGGYHPYTITATSDAVRPVSRREVEHALTPEGWLRLPTPSYSGEALITVKCADSIGSKAEAAITYIVRPTVQVSQVAPIVQAIAGSSPDPFQVSCSGGFAPYRLVPIRRGTMNEGGKIDPQKHHHHNHHHHQHHYREPYDDKVYDETDDYVHPHRSAAQVWVSGTSPDFLLTLPPVDVSQNWEIELMCIDSIKSRGTTSFRYEVRDLVQVVSVTPSSLETVVNKRPEPLEVECGGGFPPYQVMVESSTLAIVAEVHHPIGSDYKHFKVLLPTPTAKDRVELSIICVDKFSNKDRAIVNYRIYAAVTLDYVNDQRSVISQTPDSIPLRCHGGTGRSLSIHPLVDHEVGGSACTALKDYLAHNMTVIQLGGYHDRERITDDDDLPYYHDTTRRHHSQPPANPQGGAVGAGAAAAAGHGEDYVQHWELRFLGPIPDDVIRPGKSAASVLIQVICTEGSTSHTYRPSADLINDLTLQAVQFTFYVEPQVNGTLKSDYIKDRDANGDYSLTTRLDIAPRPFRIRCQGGLGTQGYQLDASIQDSSRYHRIITPQALQNSISEWKERSAEATGRFSRGANRGDSHLHDAWADEEEYADERRDRAIEQHRATEKKHAPFKTFLIELPTPTDYGQLTIAFSCRDVESDTTAAEPITMKYTVFGPAEVYTIDDLYAVAGQQPKPFTVRCLSQQHHHQAPPPTLPKWALSCTSSNQRLISNTKLNQQVCNQRAMHHTAISTEFNLTFPSPPLSEHGHSTITVTCHDPVMGQASTDFVYHVHNAVEMSVERYRYDVVDQRQIPPFVIRCHGGYAPLSLSAEVDFAMFPDVRTVTNWDDYRITNEKDREQRWEIDLGMISHGASRTSAANFTCTSSLPNPNKRQKLLRDSPLIDTVTIYFNVLDQVQASYDGDEVVQYMHGSKRFRVWCHGGASRGYRVTGELTHARGLGLDDTLLNISPDTRAPPRPGSVAYSVRMPDAYHAGQADIHITCQETQSQVTSDPPLYLRYTLKWNVTIQPPHCISKAGDCGDTIQSTCGPRRYSETAAPYPATDSFSIKASYIDRKDASKAGQFEVVLGARSYHHQHFSIPLGAATAIPYIRITVTCAYQGSTDTQSWDYQTTATRGSTGAGSERAHVENTATSTPSTPTTPPVDRTAPPSPPSSSSSVPTFHSVLSKYKVPLDEIQKAILSDIHGHLDSKSLMPILKDFIEKHLGHEHVDADASIKHTIGSSSSELSSLPWFAQHFPDSIAMRHILDVYHTIEKLWKN